MRMDHPHVDKCECSRSKWMETPMPFVDCKRPSSRREDDKKALWMSRACYLYLLLAMFLAIPAWPQQKLTDLTSESLEDLMNIKVPSVTKQDQKMYQVDATVFL